MTDMDKKKIVDRLQMLLTTADVLKAVAVTAAVIVAVIVCWRLYKGAEATDLTVGSSQVIDSTPNLIESIRSIGQWEFLTIAEEQLADTTRKGFFSDDHLVRIYYGTVRLGIDLTNLPEDMIDSNGDSIAITLPAIRLLDDKFIDEARTKSFHESGKWDGKAREALYQKAKRQMIRHSMTRENFENARANGELQVQQFLRAMGYRHVSIDWQKEGADARR